MEFVAFYRELEYDLTTGIPGFQLSDGILHWEGAQPYVLESPRGSLIVDTTGTMTPEQLGPYWQGVLVGRDRAWARQGAQVEVVLYRDLGLEISKDTVLGRLPYLKPLAVLVAALAYGWMLAARALSTTVAAALVALLAGVRGRPLPFFAAWNLAAHAVTLPLLLTFLGGQLGIRLPLGGHLLFYYGLVLVYAYLALQRVPAESAGVPPPPPTGL